MVSTFLSLDIAQSALEAAQMAQDITGNNIANANTPGYTVEAPHIESTASFSLGPGLGTFGSGVTVGSVTRSRSAYLDSQVRTAMSQQGTQQSLSSALSQVQTAYGEPSTTGLNAALTTFFQSFGGLATNPSDIGTRDAVIQNGVAVTNQFQTIQQQLAGVASQLTTQQNNDITSINSYAQQLATLNSQIRQQTAEGLQPNTILDQRDEILDQLSNLSNVTITTNKDNTVNVAIGSTSLVADVTANTVSLSKLQANGDVTDGDLAGAIQAQTSLTGYQNQFNTLAATVASQVNSIQESGAGLDGSTNVAFFQVTAGSEASTITVNPTLISNPQQLAAASVPAGPAGTLPPAGDASNALKLAALENATAINGQTIQGYYQQTLSNLGAQTSAANSANSSTTASMNQLVQQRDSISGVSTDQEMTNMLKYQQSYEAAAQYTSAANQMLSQLIGDLGSAAA